MSANKQGVLRTWPADAYGGSVYDSGQGDEHPSRDFRYSSYRKLGVMPAAKYSTTQQAVAAARAVYGPRVRTFKTARFWVVYQP